MNVDEVTWDLGELGERKGRITAGTIAAIEYLHGPIMGTVRRFATGQASFAETVTIVYATVRAVEGENSPTRDDIQAAVFAVGIGEFIEAASGVCVRVLHGGRPAEVPLQ